MKEENQEPVTQSQASQNEEEILKYWKENNIFEKTLDKDAPNGDLVFYDGPPFATGLPHYGHILGGTGKDVFARYKTMKGFRVPRRWGWDTHGLPIETIVEKSLGITSKNQIEEMGLDKFAREARNKVLGFVSDWKKTVDRTGRWVDFDGSYKTMDTTFMESVWWALGEFWSKGLIYEADRVLPYCPRCQTPLANAEIAMDNSYLDIDDISVYVKFKLKGFDNGYFLVWTTTPWTLPGNTALAVGDDIEYVEAKLNDEILVIAKDRLEVLPEGYEIIATHKGSEMIGMEYIPIFDYYKNTEVGQNKNIWKVYSADFIDKETGTGIVHIAPAFGEDDMLLSRKNSIPAIKHVGLDGKFTNDITDFAGLAVKPKENHSSTDIEIIKWLHAKNILFKKQKINHSYPHCYRCGTPILYFALSSWFIKVQQFKERMKEINQEINWVPTHLRDGRFAHNLENAPDWNISRNRFWATPLPIWKSPDGKIQFVASIDELKKNIKKSGNKYIAMRHGRGEHMDLNVCSSLEGDKHHLTQIGREQAMNSGEKLKSEKITMIIASPLIRTQETAKIVAGQIGFPLEMIIKDDRIREYDYGDKNGEDFQQFLDFRTKNIKSYDESFGATSFAEVKKRIAEFMYDLENKYQNENILIVSHGVFFETMESIIKGDNDKEARETLVNFKKPEPAEWRIMDFAPLPHNENYELDIHRPYIDAIKLEIDKVEFTRIPEVLDCWFESGSMPFAQDHYPFENNTWKENKFPSDFVVEYIAQTRTWFYYTLFVSTVLFDKSPFKNIITTGNLNASDGKKMSKSLGNYPDPTLVINKFSADALRYYLMSSVLMKGEDSSFLEKSVEDINSKLIGRLVNSTLFVEMYEYNSQQKNIPIEKLNILDKWILIRLKNVANHVELYMDKYNVAEALKPVDLFVDDLSAWYLRRSRSILKDTETGVGTMQTLKFVLLEVSKILAPIIPFASEYIYKKITNETSRESVHLESWPKVSVELENENLILDEMQITRNMVSLGMLARQKANIKVKQPLASITYKNNLISHNEELLQIIKDELNVKEVLQSAKIENEVELDTSITEDLKLEGEYRELLRAVQDLRKEVNLIPSDKIEITVSQNGENILNPFMPDFKKTAGIQNVNFQENDGKDIIVGDNILKVSIQK